MQGNIIALLDSNGVIVVQYEYDAWGNHTLSGSNLELGKINPFRYRSYYFDTETKLYFLQTRYYDPEIGRFINIDSIEYADPETINGLNLYAYCGNNPVMFTDPNGNTHWWEWLIAGSIVVASVALAVVTGGTSLVLSAALMGAAIGGGISLVSQGINYAVNGVDFSWGQFALDWGVGAITGAIGASGISRLGSTIVGAAIGGVSNVGSQLISGKSFSEINWLSVGVSAFVGGVAGALGGAGAKNRAGLNNAINGNAAVVKAQNSVAKVGDKIANGLYATARGAKSAYTQVMNRMSNAIFNAAQKHAINSIIKVLGYYAASSALLSGLSFISNW